MTSIRILTFVAIALLVLLLTWGFATNRWRRGRPAIVAFGILAALLLLTRRVSVVELLLVLSLPVALLVFSSAGRPRSRRRR